MKRGEHMRDIFMMLSLIPFFGLGFYVMTRIDFFIGDKEKKKKIKENKKDIIDLEDASSVIISGERSLVDIDSEIDKFRRSHSDFEIVIKDRR